MGFTTGMAEDAGARRELPLPCSAQVKYETAAVNEKYSLIFTEVQASLSKAPSLSTRVVMGRWAGVKV